jgi:hypothetical protein
VLLAEKELPTKYWDAITLAVAAAELGWAALLKHPEQTSSGQRRCHSMDKFRIGEGLHA